MSKNHQQKDNLEAARLASDAEARIRNGESSREALQHEAQILRHREGGHGHSGASHVRHEMHLVEQKLHRKLEHDGLLHEPRFEPDPSVGPPSRLRTEQTGRRTRERDQRTEHAVGSGTPGEIPGWQSLHEGLVEKANSTNPNIAFYGDSITEAMHVNTDFKDIFGKKAENFGIHSDTTDNLRYRLENGEMDFKNGKPPKDIVMLIGTNDMGHKSPDQIAHDIVADAELAAKKAPNSKVLLLGLLPRQGYMSEVREINQRLAEYMNGPHSANLHYADIGQQMLSNGKMVFGPAKTHVADQLWQPGGKHPTYGPGYSHLLRAIDRAIPA